MAQLGGIGPAWVVLLNIGHNRPSNELYGPSLALGILAQYLGGYGPSSTVLSSPVGWYWPSTGRFLLSCGYTRPSNGWIWPS